MVSYAGYALIASMDAGRGETYRQIVAAAGLQPLVIRDGDEARTALRRHGAPGLLLTELCLPRLDGFRLLEALRRLASPDEAPAIVVTGFPELRGAAERLRRELGISAILTRRAGPRAVQRAVKRALDRPEAGLVAPHLDEDIDDGNAAISAVPEPRLHIGWRAADPKLPPLLGPVLENALRAVGVPLGFVALADGGGVRIAAAVGFDGESLDAHVLAAQVIAANDLLVVPDASRHPLFARDLEPVMLGYAAAPIVTSHGDVIGALGVGDDGVLSLGIAELEEIALHARRVSGEVELFADPGNLATGLESGPYLSAVLSHLDSGVALVDKDQRLVHGNPALGEMCDVAPEKLAGMARDRFVAALAQLAPDPDDARRKLRVGAGVYACREEVELARPRRRVLRWAARPLRVAGELAQLETFDDITAEVDLAREREHLARTDWLTGLINRRGGEEAIGREVARSRRLGSSLCFALFDIDHFKQVNDAHGHPVGDEVLKEVAKVLHGAVRGSDLAVRWGGDELLVVLPAIPESGARVFGERVRKRVSSSKAAALPAVTVSCGVAELGKFEEASAAIARADARLYEAKAEGRNRVK